MKVPDNGKLPVGNPAVGGEASLQQTSLKVPEDKSEKTKVTDGDNPAELKRTILGGGWKSKST